MSISTYFKSAFWKPQKLTVQIALILLSCSSSLLFDNISWAQSLTRTQVLMQNQQLQNRSVFNVQSNLGAINDALKQCHP
jgi:hypothetical protein